MAIGPTLDHTKAKELAGKDWHKLSDDDRRTVTLLRSFGLLGPTEHFPGERGQGEICRVGPCIGGGQEAA